MIFFPLSPSKYDQRERSYLYKIDLCWRPSSGIMGDLLCWVPGVPLPGRWASGSLLVVYAEPSQPPADALTGFCCSHWADAEASPDTLS